MWALVPYHLQFCRDESEKHHYHLDDLETLVNNFLLEGIKISKHRLTILNLLMLTKLLSFSLAFFGMIQLLQKECEDCATMEPPYFREALLTSAILAVASSMAICSQFKIYREEKICNKLNEPGEEGDKYRKYFMSGQSSNCYQDFEKPLFEVILIFLAQCILYFYLLWAVQDYVKKLLIGDKSNGGLTIDGAVYTRYILGFFVTYAHLFTDNGKYEMESRATWHKIRFALKVSTTKTGGVTSFRIEGCEDISSMEIFFRMFMDFAVNDLGFLLIVFVAPILYAQNSTLQEFAFNFSAAKGVSQFDDSTPKPFRIRFLDNKKNDVFDVSKKNETKDSGSDSKKKMTDISAKDPEAQELLVQK